MCAVAALSHGLTPQTILACHGCGYSSSGGDGMSGASMRRRSGASMVALALTSSGTNVPVLVDQDVPLPDDLTPWDLGVPLAERR